MSELAGADLEVVDNPARSRFELVRIDEAGAREVIGFLERHPLPDDPDVLVLPHTVIDRAWRGHGLGEILVQGSLDRLRARGQTIIPQCWFVAEHLDTHPSDRDLLHDPRRPNPPRPQNPSR